MKVHELIDQLQEMDPEREVMIAHQPSWPLAETVAGVVAEGGEDAEAESVVWVVAGGHHEELSPYAPHEVFDLAMNGSTW